MCIALWLFCCTDTNTPRPLQHWWNWWQPPLPATPQYLMIFILIFRLIMLVRPSHPYPNRSVQSVHPIQTVSSQFIPSHQPSHKNPIYLSELEQNVTIQSLLWRETQQASHNASGGYNTSQSSPRWSDISEITSLLRKTHIYHLHLPQLNQNSGFIPHLFLVPPQLIFHPPKRNLPPEILPFPLILHIMLPSLLRIEISPPLRPIFGLSNWNPRRAILRGNS